jgi:hypothetical protein
MKLNQKISKIKEVLTTKIIEQICADLTTGRTDNELEPFNKVQISKFVYDNYNNINKVIEKMIEDYKEDDDLDELIDPPHEYIREYLYDFVDCLAEEEVEGDSDIDD